MNILFMGTPDFAVFSLKALVETGEDSIVGVITQPDKPQGRGYTLTPPPVKVYAESVGIPVYQPATLRGEEFAAMLDTIHPDLIVVAAYGKILPPNVLEYPAFGCINVHGSLLPAYRGAAPMQRAIIDGMETTGVTIMYMAEGLDTGDMLYRVEVPIEENDNFECIHDKLGEAGAVALLSTIRDMKNGTAQRTPQSEDGATYAKKITKEDCLIDFGKSAREVHNLIRGLSPVPLAFTHTPDGKLLKVLASERVDATEVTDVMTGKAPGTVISLDGGRISVLCGDGNLVAISRVLPEGKGRMPAADFIRGRKIAVGDLLS